MPHNTNEQSGRGRTDDGMERNRENDRRTNVSQPRENSHNRGGEERRSDREPGRTDRENKSPTPLSSIDYDLNAE